jgi:hypothetical protein
VCSSDLKTLEEAAHYLDGHEKEQAYQPEVPTSVGMIFEHTRLHLAAELAWTHHLLEQVESGKLP